MTIHDRTSAARCPATEEAAVAVVAAVESGLIRLLEDYELPSDEARSAADAALGGMRGAWIRGNCCL
jgi:hypothetical protein